MTLIPRRTKIVATLGPATDSAEVMEAIISAGVNLVRLNMSHGTHVEHQRRLELTREVAGRLHKEVGILVDLQGPKIRIARFKEGAVDLTVGQHFTLSTQCPKHAGTVSEVGLDYPDLVQQVHPGDELLLDDGRLELVVEQCTAHTVLTKVVVGGRLSNNKGINKRGGGLSAPALTDKDRLDLDFMGPLQVDYIALSFPQSASDIREARDYMTKINCKSRIIAKMERQEAIERMDEIIDASDAIMVARGDLGVELGFAQLPAVQKQLIERAQKAHRPVIIATQMMESMIYNPIPTRAEVSDVANAVLEGADAVMLSAETATGQHPIKVVQSMNEICVEAEKHQLQPLYKGASDHHLRQDQAIAMAAMYTADLVDIKAVIALTESGSTALWMSRINSSLPIFALSRHQETRGRVTLLRGVHPIYFDVTAFEKWDVSRQALTQLLSSGYLDLGDRVIVTKGDILGINGGANALKILTVNLEDHR